MHEYITRPSFSFIREHLSSMVVWGNFPALFIFKVSCTFLFSPIWDKDQSHTDVNYLIGSLNQTHFGVQWPASWEKEVELRSMTWLCFFSRFIQKCLTLNSHLNIVDLIREGEKWSQTLSRTKMKWNGNFKILKCLQNLEALSPVWAAFIGLFSNWSACPV